MRCSGVSFPVNGADRNEQRDTEGPSTAMGIHDSGRREERGLDPSATINAGNNNGDRNETRSTEGPSTDTGIRDSRRRKEGICEPPASINAGNNNDVGRHMRFTQPSDRTARRQKRSGQFRQQQAFESLRDKVKSFKKGSGATMGS